MSDNLVKFETVVSRSGYHWVKVRTPEQPPPPDPLPPDASKQERNRHRMDELKAEAKWFLTDGIPLNSERGSFDIKRPLRDLPGRLHRVFSEVEPSQDGILQFANNFGQLGTVGDLSEFIPIEQAKLKDDVGTPVGVGDELKSCTQEIRRLRVAVQLWEWVQTENEKALSDFFEWRGNDVLFNWFEDDWSYESIVISNHVRPHLQAVVAPGDVLVPAKIEVQKFINDRLYERNRAGPRLVLNNRTMKLEHHLIPNSLIGAIWLDFHLAVNGGVEFRRCEQCKEAFPAGGRGQKKRFCSDKCRVAAYRDRKEAQAGAMT